MFKEESEKGQTLFFSYDRAIGHKKIDKIMKCRATTQLSSKQAIAKPGYSLRSGINKARRETLPAAGYG
jgi:hypothetical protein